MRAEIWEWFRDTVKKWPYDEYLKFLYAVRFMNISSFGFIVAAICEMVLPPTSRTKRSPLNFGASHTDLAQRLLDVRTLLFRHSEGRDEDEVPQPGQDGSGWREFWVNTGNDRDVDIGCQYLVRSRIWQDTTYLPFAAMDCWIDSVLYFLAPSHFPRAAHDCLAGATGADDNKIELPWPDGYALDPEEGTIYYDPRSWAAICRSSPGRWGLRMCTSNPEYEDFLFTALCQAKLHVPLCHSAIVDGAVVIANYLRDWAVELDEDPCRFRIELDRYFRAHLGMRPYVFSDTSWRLSGQPRDVENQGSGSNVVSNLASFGRSFFGPANRTNQYFPEEEIAWMAGKYDVTVPGLEAGWDQTREIYSRPDYLVWRISGRDMNGHLVWEWCWLLYAGVRTMSNFVILGTWDELFEGTAMCESVQFGKSQMHINCLKSHGSLRAFSP